MKRFFLAAMMCLVTSSALASGPDTLKMKFEIKDGVHQMIGAFGSNWDSGQVQTEAAKNCAEIGKPLHGFRVLGHNAKGLTVFEARCK